MPKLKAHFEKNVKIRTFQNIAKLLREKRLNHPNGYSQSDLSRILGYKNGQFVSNIERALCNIPLKVIMRISKVLNIPYSEIKEAFLKDQEETLNNCFK